MAGMEVLSKIRVENKIFVRTAGRATERLASAIVQDSRAILMDNVKETLEKLQMQVNAEQQHFEAVGLDVSIKDLIKYYKVCTSFQSQINARKNSPRKGGIKFVHQYQPPLESLFSSYFPSLYVLTPGQYRLVVGLVW